MNAGSSPDTGHRNPFKGLVIAITEPPVVEIDTTTAAAYIRLHRGDARVARTEPLGTEDGFLMLDFDDDGRVLGIEVVGLVEFGIRELVETISKDARIEANEETLNRTRYVAATA